MTIARLMQMARAGVPAGGGDVWTDPDLSNASYDGVSFSVAGQDTIPNNLFFKDDGTKLYVSGNANDTIFQYSLSTAWDMSTASYDSVSFSVAAQATQPRIFFKPDGLKMYVIDNGTDLIFQYSLSTAWDISSLSYDSVSFSVATQEATPFGIWFKPDGTKLYVAGFTGVAVYQYSLGTAWDISTSSYDSVSFSVSAQETQLRNLFLSPNGDVMFIVGSAADAIFQYSLSTPFDVSSASYDSVSFSVGGQETIPLGFFFKPDGSKMYVVGSTNDTIFQYSTAAAAPAEWTDPDLANASYDSVSFSVAGQETAPWGVFFKTDGLKMYVTGTSGDDINEYDLGTAWDVSTATFLQNYLVSAQDTGPRSAFFKPDGTKMYFVGSAGDDINEYNLSTAWDVSSSSFVQVFSVAAQDSNPSSVYFKDDGSKMYVLGRTGASVYEYNLSTSWDVSSASFLQAFSVSSQETGPNAIFFGPNGDSFFVTGNIGDDVNEYTLTTAWDISTASFVQAFSIASQETFPTGLFFKSDGSKMYVVGLGGTSTIYQYSTA